jgi:proline racemase
VVPVISGSAHINGFLVVVADPADRFRNGFVSL